MANETQVFSKKKSTYPTKTTLNLYYKEDRSAGISTITLYLLFVAVILLALAKMFFFDLVSDLNKIEAKHEKYQKTLDAYMEEITDYDEINMEYNKYSYSYLSKQEKIQDRMEVLKMLEDTIFADSNVQSVSISGDIISVSLRDIDLEKTSVLAKNIEEYDIVESVVVNTASYGGTYTSNMVITLVPKGGENNVGGEQ